MTQGKFVEVLGLRKNKGYMWEMTCVYSKREHIDHCLRFTRSTCMYSLNVLISLPPQLQ